VSVAGERAEQLAADHGTDDGYVAGIVLAFRWLARRTAHSPVTREVITAMPETIETELLAAHTRSGQPGGHPRRVDIARGAAAALSWVWVNGPLPLVLHEDTHRASTSSSSSSA
jgi:hypothetical protein